MVGGGAPIAVQSMTNTDTADVEATARQVAALARAGSEFVRITVDRDEAAAAVPHIRDRLAAMGVAVPLVGDFHYIGHKLLSEHPACAEALDKYRINPGNVGFKNKRDAQFAQNRRDRDPQRKMRAHRRQLGLARSGAADRADGRQRGLAAAARSARGDARGDGPVGAAVGGARRGDRPARDRIILSAKVSAVQDLITVYRMLAARSDYALHLGLTEAGMGSKGIVASSAALGVLLQEGIGDTIRVSLTPEPGGDRTLEVKVAREILQTMGFRAFAPQVAACPGCGRTTSTVFQELAREIESYLGRRCRSGARAIPASRRSRSRSWAASSTVPARANTPTSAFPCRAPARRPPRRCSSTASRRSTLRGPTIAAEFKALVEDYVEKRFGGRGIAAE